MQNQANVKRWAKCYVGSEVTRVNDDSQQKLNLTMLIVKAGVKTSGNQRWAKYNDDDDKMIVQKQANVKRWTKCYVGSEVTRVNEDSHSKNQIKSEIYILLNQSEKHNLRKKKKVATDIFF